MDQQRYVSIGDGNVYLVKDDPLNYYDIEIKDVIDNDETPIFDNVKEIVFLELKATGLYMKKIAKTLIVTMMFISLNLAEEFPLDTSRVEKYRAMLDIRI